MININSFIEKEQFYHAYQPLYDLNNWYRFGFEGLLRSDIYKNPEIPFELAKKASMLFELDTKSIRKAISYFLDHDQTNTLFINILPTTLMHFDFPFFLGGIIKEFMLNSKKIVLEINEIEEVPYNDPYFRNSVNLLKREGFKIAIDDVGKGYSSLKSIIELKPDYVKMDRYFAFDLSLSEEKQEMLKSIVTFCENVGIRLILEGIENDRDLAMAKFLGVTFGQGYLLGRPEPIHIPELIGY